MEKEEDRSFNITLPFHLFTGFFYLSLFTQELSVDIILWSGRRYNYYSTMIRLSRAIGSISTQHRVTNPSSALFIRSFSKDTSDEKPHGIPYSKLTVGVPKETYPLEKRVAATPEVSVLSICTTVSLH